MHDQGDMQGAEAGLEPDVSVPCHDVTLTFTDMNGRAFASKLSKCPT